MKIAIIQEWLVTVGGSDKVVKAILDVFPDADIYTLVAKKEICDELGIPWERVHTSFIQNLPFGKSKHRAYLPLFPFALEQFDLRGYDVIISSSHCVEDSYRLAERRGRQTIVDCPSRGGVRKG